MDSGNKTKIMQVDWMHGNIGFFEGDFRNLGVEEAMTGEV